MPNPTHIPDPWSALRQHTAARIALGRAGGSLPTAELIDFAIAHAEARDAVHAVLDAEALRDSLASLGLPIVLLASAAPDRPTYLQRPDLGRRLNGASRLALTELRGKGADVALILADGLSSPAAMKQGPLVVRELLPMLAAESLRVAPLCIVRQARVAVEDEIGAALAATIAVIFIGERPGLGTAESLGAYLVYQPAPGRTDAQRNCLSNIRPGGLSPTAAAETLQHLIVESLRRKLSGVGLKDERALVETETLRVEN